MERYPIYVGFDILTQASLFEAHVSKKQVFILSHSDIAQYYLPQLEAACLQAGAIACDALMIPNGDEHKTLETASSVWTLMLEREYHRDTVIIALGGGMIGDLAGFCAACYMRGIDVIQCATTLLAQVDASIGGKTGVNHPDGKNLIGVFHQPRAVFCDLQTLTTLSQREYIAGCAELIKYGLALDADFFDWIEENANGLSNRQTAVLEYAVIKASSLKSFVVSQDERDHAQRRVLNFGHTLAHALESVLDYQHLLHGEAVAIGMVAALRLSVQNNNLNISLLQRLISLLDKLKLPSKVPSGITIVEILAKMKHDKKHINKGLQWVLLNALGKAAICEGLTSTQVEQVLMECGAKA